MGENTEPSDTGKGISSPLSPLNFNERAKIFLDFQRRYAQIRFFTLISGLFGILGVAFFLMYMIYPIILLSFLFFSMFINAGIISFMVLYVLQRAYPLGTRLDNVSIPQKALIYFDLFPRNQKNNVLHDFLSRMLYVIRIPPKFDAATMDLEMIDFNGADEFFKQRIKKKNIDYEFDILVRQTPYEGARTLYIATIVLVEIVLFFFSLIFTVGGNSDGMIGIYQIIIFDVIFSVALIGYILYITYSQGYIVAKFFDKQVTAEDVKTLFSVLRKVLEADKQNFISVVVTGKIEQNILDDIRKNKPIYENSMIMIIEQSPEQFQLIWAG
jgi:hypothetical protein